MNSLLSGTLLQRLRLGSGLVLLAFVVTHFLNHAAGLISIEAMLEVQAWRMAVTRSLVGSLVLLWAFTTHIGLGLWRLATRSTLRMPAWEALQIASGLLIPYLLIQHVAFNRGVNLAAGTRDTYDYELANLWPAFALDQTILLLLVWAHAVIGLRYWLSLDHRYARFEPVLIAVATALPILALTGFVVAGREMSERLADPAAYAALVKAAGAPSEAIAGRLDAWKSATQYAFYALAAIALARPLAMMALRAAGARIGIDYVAGPRIKALVGPSLLEISRIHGIPHASVCGGRARCSTCRVHVGAGGEDLPPPDRAERETLARVGAPPGVRLACQIHPTQDFVVQRIVAPQALAGSGPRRPDGSEHRGQEKTAAVLFFDLRGFTALSEKRLPYDIVFLLNGLFTATASAIEANGGRIDKYMGDGFMAIFDGGGSPARVCRDAMAASIAVDRALEAFSTAYAAEIGRPLRCAMGLHAGTLVEGLIGGAGSGELTVIGSVVNAASRLEALAKERNAQVVVSDEVFANSGFTAEGLAGEAVMVRGLSLPLRVRVIPRLDALRSASPPKP